MKIKISTIQALEQLLTIGEVRASELQALSTGKELGLWRLSEDKQRAVATPTAVQLRQSLPNLQETCAAYKNKSGNLTSSGGKNDRSRS